MGTCQSCIHGVNGICYSCHGDNYNHATEISNVGSCENYEDDPEILYPNEPQREEGWV